MTGTDGGREVLYIRFDANEPEGVGRRFRSGVNRAIDSH